MYLIVIVATHRGSLPVISLLLLATVYGLQVVLFLIKRQVRRCSVICWLQLRLALQFQFIGARFAERSRAACSLPDRLANHLLAGIPAARQAVSLNFASLSRAQVFFRDPRCQLLANGSL